MTPSSEQTGVLRILVSGGGTVKEVISFLSDLDTAYNSIFAFHRSTRLIYYWWYDSGFPSPPFLPFGPSTDLMLPDDRLSIRRIQLDSPGFWEFLGALNPLLQIREFLNDRHKRRQDREYREQSERERLSLDNEMIQRQIWEKDNSILQGRISILRDIGLSDDDIRAIIWASVGKPLVTLGKHQDAGLIETADGEDATSRDSQQG